MAGLNKITALLLVVIGLLQYRLWFGDGNMMELQRLGNQIQELRQEGGKRRERNAALEAEVMDLKQGLDAVEERARQDLGMIREGESFVQIIDPHHEAPPPAPPAKPEAEKKPVEEKKPKRAIRKTQPFKAPKAKPAPPQAAQPADQDEDQPADAEPPTDDKPD